MNDVLNGVCIREQLMSSAEPSMITAPQNDSEPIADPVPPSLSLKNSLVAHKPIVPFDESKLTRYGPRKGVYYTG